MYNRTIIVFVAFLLTASCFLFVPQPVHEETPAVPNEFVMDRPSRENAVVQDLSGMTDTRAFTVPSTENQRIIGRIVDNVSKDQLYSYDLTLQNFGSRVYRAPGGFNSSIWLHDVLKGNGRLQVGYHNFTVDRGALGVFTLSNVILTLPGVNASSGRTYYVFAHHDSAQYQDMNQILTCAPGADDDGSGTAAVIEAARVMSRYTFQDTIRFCCFNAEEIGLYGSYFWAKNMSEAKEDCRGSLCFDMIGYSSGTLPQDLDLWYNAANLSFAQYLNGVNTRYKIGLSILNVQNSGSIPSDIQSFYDYKFPCVMGIEEDWSPVYHTMQDTIGYMNFTLVTKTTKLAVASLCEMGRLLYTDLTVKPGNMSVNKTLPLVGEKVNVSVNVSNTGNLKANNCEVVFSDNGMQFASKRMDVAANGTNLTFAIWTAAEGLHNITVTLDPKSEIVESVESNNSAYKHVSVNDRPVARLVVDNSGEIWTGAPVSFNASFSTDNIGWIDYYNFSFGDGNFTGWLSADNVQHSYPDDGTYDAMLQVKDIFDAVSDPANVAVVVSNRPPVAEPYANESSVLTDVQVHFHANATDLDGIVSVNWNFDDGTQSTLFEPVHNFTKSGRYDVVLAVQDDDGAALSKTLVILVGNRGPSVNIVHGNLTGNITTSFELSANASDPDGSISALAWDFGDGDGSTDTEVSHAFATPGTYLVTLTARDDDGAQAVDSVFVVVLDLPPIVAGVADLDLVYTYTDVSFDSDGSFDLEGGLAYLWEFGDDTTSTDISPKHQYLRCGNYTPELTVYDSAGQSANVTLPVIGVLNWLPIPDFRVLGNLTVNGTVVFDASNSSDIEGPFVSGWDFGDNSTGKDLVTTHVFKASGNYSVVLTLTDIDDGRSYMSTKIYIKPAPKPKPAGTTTPPVNQTVKEKIVEKTNWTAVSFLIVLVIVLVLLLVIAVVFAMMRGKKKEPPPATSPVQPPAQQPAQVPGPPPASGPAVTTSTAGQPQNAPTTPAPQATVQPSVQPTQPMQTIPANNQQLLTAGK